MRMVFLVLLLLAAYPAHPAPGQERATTAETPDFKPVTWERLRAAADEPQNWLMYSGTLDGQRYSRLDQIDHDNVSQLEMKWAYQIPSVDTAETTPLIVDGVMFVTEPSNGVVALDAATGRQFWRYEHDLPDDLRLCCGPHNRGVAILGETLYASTLDAHLIALDARDGNLLWNREVADHRAGYSKTAAPLVIADQVVTGIAGGDFGIRGFVDSYDPETGDRRWRIHTIPGLDDPNNDTWAGDSWRYGGSATWVTGSYDPNLDLVYWGTGSPAPVFDGRDRPGDNLYSNSVLAIRPDIGKIDWYFQFTPHDVHGWDANQTPVLIDLDIEGVSVPSMLWANRNGFYYTFNRETGEPLVGRPFAHQTWASGIDAQFRVATLPDMEPNEAGILVSPPAAGATNWMSPAYSPRTELLYVMSFDGAGHFIRDVEDDERIQGSRYRGGRQWVPPDDGSASGVRAIDPRSGNVVWEHHVRSRTWSGLLATAGNLVFGGSSAGYFYALAADHGEALWRVPVVAPVRAGPISYAVGGKQYIAVAAGNVIYSFGLRDQVIERDPLFLRDQIQAHFARQLSGGNFPSVEAAWHTAVAIPASDMGAELIDALVSAVDRENSTPQAADDHYLASLSDKALEIAELPDKEIAALMIPALARFPVNGWRVSEALVSLGAPALCEVVRTTTASGSTDFMLWGALGTLGRFVADWTPVRLQAHSLEDDCFVDDHILGHPIRSEDTALGVLRGIAEAFLDNGSEYLPLSSAIGLAVVLEDEGLRGRVERLSKDGTRLRELGLDPVLLENLQLIAEERLENKKPPWRRQ